MQRVSETHGKRCQTHSNSVTVAKNIETSSNTHLQVQKNSRLRRALKFPRFTTFHDFRTEPPLRVGGCPPDLRNISKITPFLRNISPMPSAALQNPIGGVCPMKQALLHLCGRHPVSVCILISICARSISQYCLAAARKLT